MVANGAVAGAAANIAVTILALLVIVLNLSRAFVGLVALQMLGELFLLGKAIGMSRATHLVMTGEALTAFDYGLAYRVCESQKLDKTVEHCKIKKRIVKFLLP